VLQGDGISLERGLQREIPPENRYFTGIDSFSVKTFADSGGFKKDDRGRPHIDWMHVKK